jgi:hypothetical protein
MINVYGRSGFSYSFNVLEPVIVTQIYKLKLQQIKSLFFASVLSLAEGVIPL